MGNTLSYINLAFFAHRNYINVKIKQLSRRTKRKKTAIVTIIHPVDAHRQVADLLTTFIPSPLFHEVLDPDNGLLIDLSQEGFKSLPLVFKHSSLSQSRRFQMKRRSTLNSTVLVFSLCFGPLSAAPPYCLIKIMTQIGPSLPAYQQRRGLDKNRHVRLSVQ